MNSLRTVSYAFTILIGLFSCFAAMAPGFQEQKEQEKDSSKARITKAINTILKAMRDVDDEGNDVSKEFITRFCKKIDEQFKSIEDKDIPKDISAKFKAAKAKFEKFYNSFQEFGDKDIEELLELVGESAQDYGKSCEELLKAAKDAGYEVVDPRFSNGNGDPKTNETKAKLQALKMAIQMYRLDVNDYPDKLTHLFEKPASEKHIIKWRGPYIDKKLNALNDAWGTSIAFSVDMETGKFTLKSAGPDKKFETDDDITD